MADAPAIERAPWWAATSSRFEKTNTDKGIAWRRALKAAGLDWDIEKVPVTAKGIRSTFPGAFGLITSEGQPLAVVGDRYEPLSNASQAKWVAALGDDHAASLVNVWSLENGRIVGMTLALPDTVPVGNGSLEVYVNVVNDHSGGPLDVQTFLLVPKVNVLVLSSQAHHSVRLSETANGKAEDSLLDAANGVGSALSNYRVEINAMVEASIVGTGGVDAIIKKLWPKPSTDKALAQWHNRRQAIHGLLNNRSSVWGAFLAVAEYVQWERPARGSGGDPKLADAMRAEELLVGYARQMTEKAYAAAVGLTNPKKRRR